MKLGNAVGLALRSLGRNKLRSFFMMLGVIVGIAALTALASVGEATRQETMRRLLLGLVRRTRQRIYLGASDYSEGGFEQRGPLLTIVNRLLSL